jgi:hypothetical protein
MNIHQLLKKLNNFLFSSQTKLATKKILKYYLIIFENVQASTNVQYPICGGLTKKQTPCPFNIDPSKPWNIGRGSAVTTIMRHPWNSQ